MRLKKIKIFVFFWTCLFTSATTVLSQKYDRILKQITIRSTSRLCIAPSSEARFMDSNAYLTKGMKLIEVDRIDIYYAEIAKTENLKRYFKKKLSSHFEKLLNEPWYFYDKGGRNSPDGFDSDPEYFIHNWFDDEKIFIAEDQVELGIFSDISQSFWDMLKYDIQHDRITPKCNIILAGKGQIYKDIIPILGERKVILKTPDLGNILRDHPGRLTLNWHGLGIPEESTYYIAESHIYYLEEEERLYQNVDGFMITEAVIQALEQENIPPGFLKKLRELTGKKYKNKESFVKILEKQLGKPAAKKYAPVILKFAIISSDEVISDNQSDKANMYRFLILFVIGIVILGFFLKSMVKRKRQKRHGYDTVNQFNAATGYSVVNIPSSTTKQFAKHETEQQKNSGLRNYEYETRKKVQNIQLIKSSKNLYNKIEDAARILEILVPHQKLGNELDERVDTPEKLLEKSTKMLALISQEIDNLKRENKWYKDILEKVFNVKDKKSLNNFIVQLNEAIQGIEIILKQILENQYTFPQNNLLFSRLISIKDNLEKISSISLAHSRSISKSRILNTTQKQFERKQSNGFLNVSSRPDSSTREGTTLSDKNDYQRKKLLTSNIQTVDKQISLKEIEASCSQLFTEIYKNALALTNSENEFERDLAQRIIRKLESLRKEWKFSKDALDSDVAKELMRVLAPLWYSIKDKDAFEKIFKKEEWNIVYISNQVMNEKNISELNSIDIEKIRKFILSLEREGIPIASKKRIVLEPTIEWKGNNAEGKQIYKGKYIYISPEEMEQFRGENKT